RTDNQRNEESLTRCSAPSRLIDLPVSVLVELSRPRGEHKQSTKELSTLGGSPPHAQRAPVSPSQRQCSKVIGRSSTPSRCVVRSRSGSVMPGRTVVAADPGG